MQRSNAIQVIRLRVHRKSLDFITVMCDVWSLRSPSENLSVRSSHFGDELKFRLSRQIPSPPPLILKTVFAETWKRLAIDT